LKKNKTKNKNQTTNKVTKNEIDFSLAYEPSKIQNYIIYIILAVISVSLSMNYIMYASGQNGFLSFPLDDPWIHLTFAKNLVEFGSFSYFKNEMATAGSTSPIYTLFLAIGFIFTKNEMILSYLLGIIFLVCSVFAFYKLSRFEFGKETYFAIGASVIFLSDKWMNFIADSGMETTMYIFMIILGFYFYKKRQAIPLGIMLGLILWGRPDGVAFYAAIVIDYLILIWLSKNTKGEQTNLFSKQDLIKVGITFGILLVIYFAMNLILSGSLLPNTYNAKLAYYSPEFRSRGDFFKFEVWDYFTSGAYGVLMIGFLFSTVKTIFDLFKKKYSSNFSYILFSFLLVFIYWYKLPYAHRFGRYLMPIIPFLILVGLTGFRDASKIIGSAFNSRSFANGFYIIVLLICLSMSVLNYNENKSLYADECKYIYDRQVKAALWINQNTNENDIIGTHDVGAIGFYSGRKIVDVAGLVTPELIDKIHDRNYVKDMEKYMKESGVTYLVFLREWYRVVNQKPLFSTADSLPPEVMEIYKYTPDSTVILSKESNSINMYAENLLQQRQFPQAVNVLNKSIASTPNSSYTYFLLASAYSMTNDAKNMEASLLKAVELYPEFKEAHLQLANYYLKNGFNEKAKFHLDKSLAADPNYKFAKDLEKMLPQDSTKK